MNIDDRIRSAQKRQLEVIESDLRHRGLDRPPLAGPTTRAARAARAGGSSRGPWIMAIAAVAIVGGLAVTVWPSISRPTEVTTSAGDPVLQLDEQTAPGDEPQSDPPVTTSAPTTTSSTADSLPAATVSSTPAVADETAADQPTVEGSTGPTSTSPTSPSTSPSSSRPASTGSAQSTSQVPAPTPVGAGVVNDVCASGFRAPLERAALRYLSEERGWNRMADLTNEQDGPDYYGLWEPDYPGTVTVEVRLAEPVEATEVRLAQHPFAQVSGTITVDAGGQVLPIELSGMGGWRSHVFAQPTVLESFTITRNQPESNIVEVLVCVTG